MLSPTYDGDTEKFKNQAVMLILVFKFFSVTGFAKERES